jgi:hypothetical protein
MRAIETLLAGLIDYAGLYPPAGLDMRAAMRNYLEYRAGKHAFALGRFIVDAAHLHELRDEAGEALRDIPLSVIVAADAPSKALEDALNCGMQVESVEVKCSEPAGIRRLCEQLSLPVALYFEISIGPGFAEAIDAVASVGAFAKLRMGGVVPEAFPRSDQVSACLRSLAERQVPFKATAGLHHPIRSRRCLTYEAGSACAMMHGFVNLFCATAITADGVGDHAQQILEEEDSAAFRILPDRIGWRSREWNGEQIHRIRTEFFRSFGSCSFVEPMQDLEALGWL